jgi:hypothetical protein
MTCLASFGPSVCFLFFFYMFFSLICSIIHICQPPAACFDPQPRFPPQTMHFNPQPHILTIWPCLSTPSHAFRPPSCLFQHPQAQMMPDTSFGPMNTGIEERVGNVPKQRQTRRLGPRCIFFFFLHVFFIYLPYYCHLPAPSYMFQPPATLFDHPAMSFHSQPHVFNTHQPFPAPQVLKHAYEQLYVCFLYFFFFGFENACMSNRTHVSYLFSFFFPSLPLGTCV